MRYSRHENGQTQDKDKVEEFQTHGGSQRCPGSDFPQVRVDVHASRRESRAVRPRPPRLRVPDQGEAMSYDKAKIEAARERRLQWFKPSNRGIVQRAWSGKSRRAGVQAFCLECVGEDKDAIRHCTALACPLWPYRPYQTSD